MSRPAPRRTLAALVCFVATSTLGSIHPAGAAPTDGPVFEDGLSQAAFSANRDSWIRQEVWVQADSDSDGDGEGDRIHVSLARPAESVGVKVPVLLQDSPYFAGLTEAAMWNVDHPLGQPPGGREATPPHTSRDTSPIISTGFESTWVPRGFAVAQMESPGSGLSDGCATTGGANETAAAKAVIEWFDGKGTAYTSQNGEKQATPVTWSNGNVGMTGTSYNGTLPIAAASTGVENLKAIVPDAAISSWYGYYRSGGAVRAPGGYQGEDADVLADFVTTRPDREVCDGVLADLARKQDRSSGDYSAFWDERNYLRDAHRITAATLISHGFRDANVMPDQADNLYDALAEHDVPRQIFLHQGGHGGPPTDDLMNRWFTRYLWEHRNGVEQEPKAYVVPEGGGRGDAEAYPDWPLPGTSTQTWHAGGDGTTRGTLSAKRSKPSHDTQRVVDDASRPVPEQAAAAASPHRLAYLTPPLAESTVVSGTPSATVRASFSAARANVTVALVEYAPDGTATVLSRGWADPRNARSLSREKALRPGKPVTLTVPMQPKHTTVDAGHRLGLVVMQSDKDFTLRPPAGTRMEVVVRDVSVDVPTRPVD